MEPCCRVKGYRTSVGMQDCNTVGLYRSPARIGSEPEQSWDSNNQSEHQTSTTVSHAPTELLRKASQRWVCIACPSLCPCLYASTRGRMAGVAPWGRLRWHVKLKLKPLCRTLRTKAICILSVLDRVDPSSGILERVLVLPKIAEKDPVDRA